MHNKIYVIEQDPLRLLVAFHVSWTQAGFVQPFLNFGSDSLNLPRIGSAAHDKVVGKCAGILFKFQHSDFFRLLFLAGADGFGDLALEVGFLHSVVGRWPEYSSSVIGRRRQSHCS